jgi:hypothetical protein
MKKMLLCLCLLAVTLIPTYMGFSQNPYQSTENDIVIKCNGISINRNSEVDIDAINPNKTEPMLITINNTSCNPLELYSRPMIRITGPDFVVDQSLLGQLICPGSNGTFLITFSPTAADGLPKKAAITIKNSFGTDYIFTVKCTNDPTPASAAGTDGKKIEPMSSPIDVSKMPPVDITELKDNIPVKQKPGVLHSAGQPLPRQWNIAVYSHLMKSVFLDTYIPTFSILSIESDAFWYYADTIGVGFGYGYSYNYPGTWGPACNIIPCIHEHELRIIPFAFRTDGALSFSCNVIAALNLHNTIDVNGYKFNASDNKQLMIFYAKLGVNIGIVYNITDSFGIFWNGLFLNYAIPLLVWNTVDGSTSALPLGSFSLDIGGPGIIYRF